MFIVQLVGITILCAMATMAVVIAMICFIIFIGDKVNGESDNEY